MIRMSWTSGPEVEKKTIHFNKSLNYSIKDVSSFVRSSMFRLLDDAGVSKFRCTLLSSIDFERENPISFIYQNLVAKTIA